MKKHLVTLFTVIVFLTSFTYISCTDAKPPIAIVSNGDTTLVSPIDDSLYMKLQCKYDSLKNELVTLAKLGIHERDSLQHELDFQNKYLNTYLYITGSDTLKKIPYMPKVIVFPKKPKYYNDIDSVKAYADSLRVHLIRVNLLSIRVKRYVDIADKNPKKYAGFLRGWDNGLFKNQ